FPKPAAPVTSEWGKGALRFRADSPAVVMRDFRWSCPINSFSDSGRHGEDMATPRSFGSTLGDTMPATRLTISSNSENHRIVCVRLKPAVQRGFASYFASNFEYILPGCCFASR